MAGSALKARAFRLLTSHPNMTPRDLQETLHCDKSTAYQFVRQWKEQQKIKHETPMRTPVLELVRGTTARTPAEELPKETQDLVVEELQGLMLYVIATRKRMMRQHEDLRPIEHSQFANAIASITKSIQTLCDTYPGIAQLTTRKLRDQAGFSDADLNDINSWLEVVSS